MQRPVRIACFGDSLTEGYGLPANEALPVVLERMLRDEGVDAECRNHGVSGETAEDGLVRLARVIADEPDAAIVEFGANDCFVGDPVDVVRASLSNIIRAFQERHIAVLLVGITAELAEDDTYRRAFDALFRELAECFEVPLFPDILAPYFGSPDLTLMDGLHPNAQGVEAMARALLPQAVELARTAADQSS